MINGTEILNLNLGYGHRRPGLTPGLPDDHFRQPDPTPVLPHPLRKLRKVQRSALDHPGQPPDAGGVPGPDQHLRRVVAVTLFDGGMGGVTGGGVAGKGGVARGGDVAEGGGDGDVDGS